MVQGLRQCRLQKTVLHRLRTVVGPGGCGLGAFLVSREVQDPSALLQLVLGKWKPRRQNAMKPEHAREGGSE